MHSNWSCSVLAVVGREPMAEQEAKEDQVASSMTPWEINNKLILEHSRDIMSEMILSSNQNEAECHEVMFILETTATYVIGGAQHQVLNARL